MPSNQKKNLKMASTLVNCIMWILLVQQCITDIHSKHSLKKSCLLFGLLNLDMYLFGKIEGYE
uniref:Uncharacterized protein n=1 Tax=viral metagenome TaxID=1070528 RepID=A0A6C0JCU6_9ZZZZ